MATTPILWDSFESYSAVSDLTGTYVVTGANTAISSDPARARTGTQSAVIQGEGTYATGDLLRASGFNAEAVVVQFAWYYTSHTDFTDRLWLEFMDASNQPKVRIVTHPGGGLGLRVGFGGNSATSAGGILNTNTLLYVEVAYYSHISNGYISVYIDGILVVSFTGDTRGTVDNIDSITFRSSTIYPAPNHLSDLVVSTVAGPTDPSTDRLGAVTHTIIPPTSDVLVDGTPSAGATNALMVDESPHDGDTTYVDLALATEKDLYAHGSTVPAGETPIGVAVFSVQKLVTGGEQAIRHLLDNGVTQVQGADKMVNDAYGGRATYWSGSPFTASPWDAAEVNSLRFGIEARE